MATLQKQEYQQLRGLNSWFTRDELNIERTIVLRFHSQGANDLLKIYLWAFFKKLYKMCLSEYVLVHSAN